jgi:hypothetical protein
MPGRLGGVKKKTRFLAKDFKESCAGTARPRR